MQNSAGDAANEPNSESDTIGQVALVEIVGKTYVYRQGTHCTQFGFCGKCCPWDKADMASAMRSSVDGCL